jgi:sugar lactone lactonase YvrE
MPKPNQTRQRSLYVTELLNNRVIRFALKFTSDDKANLVIGQSDFTSASQFVTANRFSSYGVALDRWGNLFVSDAYGARVLVLFAPLIQEMSADVVLGQKDFISVDRTIKANTFGPDGGITLDSVGNLYVPDFVNNRVLQFRSPFATGMEAYLVLGQPDFLSSTGATTRNKLYQPRCVALDAEGNLYVSEFANNRVVQYKPPFSDGMNASVVVGQSNFTERKVGTTQTNLKYPGHIAVDKGGSLYVVDAENHRVLQFRPPFSNGIAASIVIGQTDFISSASGTTPRSLSFLAAVAVDDDGNLYVSDTGNNRILVFKSPLSNGMSADRVLGQPDFTARNPSLTQRGLNGPIGLAIQ